jgi:sucrose-phosphate synthase
MPDYIAFAVATGRNVYDAKELFTELDLPSPDIWITDAGTRMYYGTPLVPDKSWARHLNHYWEPMRIHRVLSELEGIELQDPEFQAPFKVSYFVSRDEAPDPQELKKKLRKRKLRTKVVHSYGAYYDILPIRASVGLAVRYLAYKLDIPPERILAVGYSGMDEDLLSGNTLGVVVGNSNDLEHLREKSRIYFSKGSNAWGLLEGLEHYNFIGEICVPEEELEDSPR